MSLKNKLQTVGVLVVVNDPNTNQQLVFSVAPDAKPIRLKVRIDQHESELVLHLSEKSDVLKSGDDLALTQRLEKVELAVPTAVQVESDVTPVVVTPPAKVETSSKKK